MNEPITETITLTIETANGEVIKGEVIRRTGWALTKSQNGQRLFKIAFDAIERELR